MLKKEDDMPAKQLSVVIPVNKEAKNIQPFLKRLESVLNNMGLNYEIIFCMDPSPDNTQEVIEKEINRNPNITLMIFSRRFGQPAATLAGILACKGQNCVVIDVDLQDPPELIIPMYEKLQQDYEVVYAKRKSRQGETLVKKIISY